MRIQHNIAAMNAYRNYNTNTSALAKNLEKLSSGYKINRAGDDAAGLAISEKMRAQITGLNAAQKNVKDGISLVKTAEGAMQEIHDMLNRMDYLATQSANGTYDNEVDRANLQKEVESLKSEINRIADSANFNGIKLLNGERAAQSTSALGGTNATVLDTIDGTSPSKAGAAEITLKLANNAAANSTILEPKTQQDGKVPDKASAAEIVISGLGADKAATVAVSSALTDFTPSTGAASFAAGDQIEVTLADGTQETFAFTSTAGVTTGNVFNTGAELATKMAAQGLTLNADGTVTEQKKITLIAGTAGAPTTITIAVGDDLTDLLAATVGSTGKTVADLFDVKVNDGATDTAVTAGNVTAVTVGATDKITLTAKVAGEQDADVKTFADNIKGLNGKKVTTYTPGVDEGDTASANNITKYDLSIDLDKLRGGMKLSIGTSGTTATEILFKTDGTASAANTATGLIVNLNQSAASVAADLKTALDTAFGTTNFNGAESNADEITDKSTAFTYKIEGKSNSVVDSSNMGEIRVFDNGGAQTTTAAVSSTYKPAAKDDPNASTSGAFAKVSYEIGTSAITVGSKITIGDKTIEIVDGTSTSADFANGKITSTAITTDIAKALEQMGYDSGKVSVTVAGTTATINIEGITVGEKATDLAKGAGQVSFMDASKAVASKATAGTNVIEAGTTKISDIKDFGMPDGKKLSDIFSITVNGNAQDNDYVIKEGDEIKFTAKNNGQYKDEVMTKFDFTGDVDSLSKKNGWDEGSGATGDKTHYELAIDLSKVAGGNSFTFGNVNGKSYTFDLSFDDAGTKNDTIGDDKNTDIANNGTRTTINLYGLSTADAQKAIFTQVQNVMQGAGFDVTRSISGSKMTLALDAQKEGPEYNLGNIRTSSASGALTNAVYNPAGGNAGGTPGTMAQVTYKFDPSQLQAGDSLTIGDTTIYIGDETKKEVVDGKVKLTVAASAAQTDPNKAIVEALESAGYRSGQVRFDTTDPNNSTVTITGIQTGQTAEDLKANGAKITLSSSRALEKGGLTLQIGDTAESFNQMIVSIGSMKTSAMGTDDKKIADINIGTQEGAKEAIDVIKGAINYVSSVRGDLGAIQNRLEHTGNNLSVMAENIQDAESTIRDTDVAEEMMSYVKNNILVQSAQAMLAQANQLPQGVLQLLG